MAMTLPCGNRVSYLERVPERLVVEGFRRWMAGYDHSSIEPWELAWNLYASELGLADARRAIAELSFWVRTVRYWADRPIACFPYGCQRLCREECFVASMIAAVQNGDQACLEVALAQLIPAEGRPAASAAAQGFGAALADIGQRLMPVPVKVVEDIARRPAPGRYH